MNALERVRVDVRFDHVGEFLERGRETWLFVSGLGAEFVVATTRTQHGLQRFTDAPSLGVTRPVNATAPMKFRVVDKGPLADYKRLYWMRVDGGVDRRRH